MQTEMQWHPNRPEFSIRAQMISFVVQFTPDMLVVDAELSLAAKLMATQQNRATAVQFIESIATELGI